MTALLRLVDLHVARSQRTVVDGVDLEVGADEAVALLGTNGAGKSTLLQAATGALAVRRGRIEVGGTDATRWSPARHLAAGIVHVPGGRATFPHLTVGESLRLACWPFRRDRARVTAALARVHERFPVLAERDHQAAGSLSGGEQQLLALAKAVVHRPALLVVDELTLGLAPVAVDRVVAVVDGLRADGVALLLVDQRLAVAARLTDRAYFLERGRVRSVGPTAALAGRDDLVRSVFLGGAGGR